MTTPLANAQVERLLEQLLPSGLPQARLAVAADPTALPTAALQDTYCELMQTAYPELRKRAQAGEESVQLWLERFIALGRQLGVQVANEDQGGAATSLAPVVAVLVQQCFAGRRIPSATYRLQFNQNFTFRDAQNVVPYLRALGISDCYASPVFQARSGSSHGYDICDHGRLSLELGGERDFDAFAKALRDQGMGLILDVVPNHMGIGDVRNAWWMDVLENGPSSVYASFFDIEWHPVNPDLENKVLLPFLEDQYGRVLEAGKIQLAYREGAFFLCYYQTRLPIEPCTYATILDSPLANLARTLGEEQEQVRELRSILTALRYLPSRTELSAGRVVERNREKEVVKRRLAVLCDASSEVRAAIEDSVRALNGSVGDPRSFDGLDRLIDLQAYRPSFWRVATEEINYRRFFDINELAAIRMEAPEVFEPTHQLIFRLLSEGKATGLRIDHPDGLWNPGSYFRQLQETFVLGHVRARLHPGRAPENLAKEVAQQFAVQLSRNSSPVTPWPLYVVAEKILCEGEPLPQDWAVDGTTGYDFLNGVNGLLVAGEDRDAFDRSYREFTKTAAEFHQLVNSAKKMTMLVSMASEINALSHQLDRIAERNRRCRDFTLNSLTFAIREIIACLGVYRTYITGPEGIARRDQLFIEAAVEEAKRRNPRTAEAIFDFVRDTLLLCNRSDFQEADQPKLVEWAMKFQQLTGPIMAKSVEDTVFYTYNRLVSLNEVGGSPDRYGLSVAAFHRQNADRLGRFPHTMLSTSTHDTKRSEDVRARLNALSELAGEWQAAHTRWSRQNSPKKTVVEDQAAPDANDEYLLYQTLLGAWPAEPWSAESTSLFRERVAAYMQKATKEAKVHTSWINPNEEYDAAVRGFVFRLLPDTADDPFLSDLLAFQRRVAYFGYFNSLVQVLLKLTCPGVPDFYQGSELWDFSLVDPDNRRPVDYPRRRQVLTELQDRIDGLGQDLTPLTEELVANLADGRIKLFLTARTLNFRLAHEPLFAHGSYLPLEAAGSRRDHVCAFARFLGDEVMVAAVPRLVVRLVGKVEQPPLGSEVWEDTWLLLPQQLASRSYRNLYTGEVVAAGNYHGTPGLSLAAVMKRFPVALLEGCATQVAA